MKIKKLRPRTAFRIITVATMAPVLTFGIVSLTEDDSQTRWLLIGVYAALAFAAIYALDRIRQGVEEGERRESTKGESRDER